MAALEQEEVQGRQQEVLPKHLEGGQKSKENIAWKKTWEKMDVRGTRKRKRAVL